MTTGAPDAAATPAALLYHEADLLDQRRFEEWLGLFAADARYWVPIGDGEDPERVVSIIYDDRSRLAERVERLVRGVAPSQRPPSRTCHLVGNLDARREDDAWHVRSRLVVVEYRRGEQSLYAGEVEHLLAPAEDGALRIRRKVVRLVNSAAPLGNLSFPL